LDSGRETSRRSGSEEKSFDGSLDEEFGSSLGGISEESNDSSLLLAASATETAESTVVFVSSGVLLLSGKLYQYSRPRKGQKKDSD